MSTRCPKALNSSSSSIQLQIQIDTKASYPFGGKTLEDKNKNKKRFQIKIRQFRYGRIRPAVFQARDHSEAQTR